MAESMRAAVKVVDLAFARLQVPDLGVAEEFLTNFGLQRVDSTPRAVYFRGSCSSHHIYVAELGEPRFRACAFHAADEDDLTIFASRPGASGIEHIDEPGGGKRVRLTDPLGYDVEVVHGIEAVEEIPVPREPTNTGMSPSARKTPLRLGQSPTLVKRIAHIVLSTPHVQAVAGWYRQQLGLLSSDEVYAGSRDHIIGSFNRVDRGEEYVDHHSMFFSAAPGSGLHHISFEVPDVDAVFRDHEYLRSLARYRHFWGIGRHVLGSQVFDYWFDPWGRVHEHWADTDRLNAQVPSGLWSAQEGLGNQWGPPPPELIKTLASP